MKKLLSLFMCLLLITGTMFSVAIPVSAQEVEIQETGIAVPVTTYDELKKMIYNSPNREMYVLQNDIVIEDNENDNEIVVSSLTRCILDLNGYTLSRATRGIDSCLINVRSDAQFSVVDSSEEKTGGMIFSSGNYAGTSAVIVANGYVDIYGGNYEIKTPYEVGGGAVFLVETGYLNIYDGVFDSHTAFGGDTIELRHNAHLYTVPHCNIYDGTFYGKISNFEVSSFGDYSNYGCLFPSVYVFDGEFYIAKPDDEYAGFAYCNNGWGQVIVAGGTVFYKCVNSRDQKFLDGVSKNYTSISFAEKTGNYCEVTPPVMIGSEDLSSTSRLESLLSKKDLSYYSKKGTVYEQNQELFEYVLGYVDTINVYSAQEQSPLLWIENTDSLKTVSWYMCDEKNYDAENTSWVELSDYAGRVQPFRFDFRPEDETVLYIRSLITMDDGSEIEDVIAIRYEEFIPNPAISTVDITGVTTPVAEATPDFLFDDTEQYCINAVYWKDVTTNEYLKESEVFVAGHTYELEVWLRANDNYKFKTDSDDWVDITASVGGKHAEVIGNEIAVILTVTYTLNEEELMIGDVDCDGKVTVMDATAIQRYIAKTIVLDEKQLVLADTDGDSKIAIMDATAIQRYIAKLIPDFN